MHASHDGLGGLYDALISRRDYKKPMPHEKAMEIMLDERGEHFDPDLLDTFSPIQQEVHEIARRYEDSEHDMQVIKQFMAINLSSS